MVKVEKNNLILKNTVDGVRDIKDLEDSKKGVKKKVYFVREGEEDYVLYGTLEEVEAVLEDNYVIVKEFGVSEYKEAVEEEESENIRIIGRSLYDEVNSLLEEVEELGEIEVKADLGLIDYVKEVKDLEPQVYKIRKGFGEEVVIKDEDELGSKLDKEFKDHQELKLDIIFKGCGVFRQIVTLVKEEGQVGVKDVQYVTVKGIYQYGLEEDISFESLVESIEGVCQNLK